ncbi:endonuclease/exonuclease/phosphatase family metal-dependent hydrolase [Agromyces sp. 3263]|uniref:endonuclease/exonuclease/phosphatase family protein n=1 Tax=Agromyces sp. 3263 TaxID=2817750 RepID=UPI0028604C20|nr:endonuclease/exonuclease/phosphatase family protein [Agromyces sp. 3263]MDR6906967.1 endonuclease/exonuclease/phosphatase family metal-dependent hydrolase [Agromyces sp. 3263]
MTDAALIGPVPAPELHVMTYNIRRRLPHVLPGSPDRWSTRRPLVRRILAAEQPTILGVQEALADQVDDVGDALGSRYRWIGFGRNPSGRGERCPIFYDDDRLELRQWRQFALSSTPEVAGSRSWGNLVRRVVVTAEFTDRATGARVLASNTHLDHLSTRSRLESARYLVARATAASAADPEATIVLTGDVNADVDSAVHRRLTETGVLRDTWEAATERLTPQWGTFSNYRRLRQGGKRIDLILVGPGVVVERTGINAVRFDGAAASDHEPVQAVIRPAAAVRAEAA